MYHHTLHCGRKHFCYYCLYAFRAEGTLKFHINNCFKINGKGRIKIPKQVHMLDSKIYENKKYKNIKISKILAVLTTTFC